MQFYFYFLFSIMFFFMLAKLDKLVFKASIFFLISISILIAGLRYGIGTDYENYRVIYENIETASHIEPGYKYVNIIFNNLGLSYEFSVFVFAFVTNILMYRFIKNYSVSFMFSLLLYILLNYYFITFNAVRQMLAIAIFLQAIPCVKNRGYVKFVFITVFAALFHYSILIGFIYMFFIRDFYVILLILWCLSLIFIVIPIQNIIIKLMPASFHYAVYLSSSFFTETSKLSVLKLIIPNLFVVLLFLYLPSFRSIDSFFWVNAFIFSIVGLNVTHGVNVLIRLNYVFQISEVIFYPLFLSKVSKREKPIVSYLFLLYVVLFYILTVIIQGAQGVVPYKSILFL